MDKKEILIESAKYIAEHCAEHGTCNENCVFYMESGKDVCLFHTAYTPNGWKLNAVKKRGVSDMNKWKCNCCGADVREQEDFIRFQGVTYCNEECLMEEIRLSSEFELCTTEFEDFDDDSE